MRADPGRAARSSARTGRTRAPPPSAWRGAATGRPLVLVSGYHGWQDWYLESGGFADEAAVAPAPGQVAHFRFHDAAHLERMLEENRGRVAAVMLEPGAAIAGLNGPVRGRPRLPRARRRAGQARGARSSSSTRSSPGCAIPAGACRRVRRCGPTARASARRSAEACRSRHVVGTREAFAALPRASTRPELPGRELLVRRGRGGSEGGRFRRRGGRCPRPG